MCMVRNSIGAHAYTCDEVITARSGKRIHIYNTDAEGRITMLDPLTRAKEEVRWGCKGCNAKGLCRPFCVLEDDGRLIMLLSY